MAGLVVDARFVYQESKHLTVLKTSLFFPGDGFAVYDCNGKLVFRVDSFGPDSRFKDVVVLMDPNGRCLLTLRRKRLSLRSKWEAYRGDGYNGQKPIFSVSKSSIIGRCTVNVEVYNNPDKSYHVEGNFAARNCKIVDSRIKKQVAEIRRKVESATKVELGKEVFSLCLQPGSDSAFVMGLVLILDQIHRDTEKY